MAIKDNTLNAELRRAALHVHIYSRVARQLGVHRSHVRRVALGLKTSKRVAEAIRREIRRIDRQAGRAAA